MFEWVTSKIREYTRVLRILFWLAAFAGSFGSAIFVAIDGEYMFAAKLFAFSVFCMFVAQELMELQKVKYELVATHDYIKLLHRKIRRIEDSNG
jgi:hypothetical protein